MITHLTDGFYKNAYWDAVIGHSQGAIDALRMRLNWRATTHNSTIVTKTHRGRASVRCVPGARYLNLHTREFGLARLGRSGGSCAATIWMILRSLIGVTPGSLTLPADPDGADRAGVVHLFTP